MNKDEKWLKSVQRKLAKYIHNEKWDYLDISDLYLSMITKIMNCETIKDLPLSIDEKTTDYIFQYLDDKFKALKTSKKRVKEYER